jgi:hypothetical protein
VGAASISPREYRPYAMMIMMMNRFSTIRFGSRKTHTFGP